MNFGSDGRRGSSSIRGPAGGSRRDEELFYGSLDRTTVHPRVILQKALKHNAGAIVAYHNHPSSAAEPSASDMSLTGRVKDLLDEIDVRLLDHIVVSRTETVSIAVGGLASLRRLAKWPATGGSWDRLRGTSLSRCWSQHLRGWAVTGRKAPV